MMHHPDHNFGTLFFSNQGVIMPRVTINLPNNLNEKFLNYAANNDVSLSYTIVKMGEIGLMVTERQLENKTSEDKFSEVEVHCFKLIIQMNALIKNMAKSALGYGQDEFKKLIDLSDDKYQDLRNIVSKNN
ncbi:hypothetical protein [Legionella sp.]|uniref:hypothetical protein n=1 Tax=Legionella sp. TaxID=459 RepID=UPI00321FCDA2